MSNLFQKTSSNWVRYDKYEWKEDKEGTLYIIPSPDAKVSLYNPLKDSEQMVLKAVNLGLMCMDKNNTQERLQNAVMDFVTGYGLLGFMTALPTTPDFITYHAVYLPKNHFIKEESMTTEKYLSYFFPFDKIDFVKKGMESSGNTDDVQMMALIMTMKNKPQAVMMSFQKEYASDMTGLLLYLRTGHLPLCQAFSTIRILTCWMICKRIYIDRAWRHLAVLRQPIT